MFRLIFPYGTTDNSTPLNVRYLRAALLALLYSALARMPLAVYLLSLNEIFLWGLIFGPPVHARRIHFSYVLAAPICICMGFTQFALFTPKAAGMFIMLCVPLAGFYPPLAWGVLPMLFMWVATPFYALKWLLIGIHGAFIPWIYPHKIGIFMRIVLIYALKNMVVL